MEEQQKSQGRGRGRGRAGGSVPSQTGGGQQHKQPGTSQAAGRSTVNPWGQPQGGQPQTAGRQNPSAWGQSTTKVAPGPATITGPSGGGGDDKSPPGAQGGAGRATMHRGTAQPRTNVLSRGNGNGGEASGVVARGSLQRNRFIPDIATKPTSIDSKKGKTGRQITLQANYFRLIKTPTWCLYQYRVDFAPDLEVNSLRKGLLKMHKALFKGYLFDGTVLFSTKKLEIDPTELFSTLKSNDEVVKITLKFVGMLSMTEASSIQVLNLIMRGCLDGLELQLVGRNFFDAIAKIRIENYKLELWPGYITTIRQHEKDILLCAEITHKVMRNDTVYDLLQESIRDRDYQEHFLKQVIGMTVLTGYNNKTYRIDDVDFKSSPNSTFHCKKSDTQVSYVSYYKTRYNITIRDLRQPVLVSRLKAKDLRGGQQENIVLIPELCRVTGLSENMKTNFKLMKEVSDHTRIAPGSRIQKLLAFNTRVSKTPNSCKILEDWDMRLDKQLVELIGRELPPEKIVFKTNKVPTGNRADWTASFRNEKLFALVDLKRWSVISPSKCMKEAQDFISLLQQAGKGMGFMISNPDVQTLNDDRGQSYNNCIEKVANTDPQLIMCIVPNNRADRYSSIKKKLCVDRPIPSQVMCLRTITPKGGNVRSLMSVATKVGIQMNCKLGASPWMVDIPLTGLMTIGYDVCHDTCDRSKSYGAMVATMDLKQTSSYFSTVSAHRNGEELSNFFSLNIVKAITQYRNIHGTLPERICIYRDGVGEGQLNYVYEHEVDIIKSSLKKIYDAANIATGLRMAFIIVTKRLNTRIFYNKENPPPGTVVDDVITSPEKYDFFLISQSVNTGSVSPTMYNVIYDTMGLPPDRIQMLTYKMCHLYYNWSGTTRVPAVCQYAHKLAALVGMFIHQDPSHHLEKQLYFL